MKIQLPSRGRLALTGFALLLPAVLAAGASKYGDNKSAESVSASIQKSVFGKTPEGTEIELYTLTNKKGLVAKVTAYGAILTELRVPDRQGRLGDIVLGFDNLDQYVKGHPFFGATTGRVANRIARGTFT